MIVAAIGSRRTPHSTLVWMVKAGRAIVRAGHRLRSGNGRGADQAWAFGGNLEDPSAVELCLPWKKFEWTKVAIGNKKVCVEDLPRDERHKLYEEAAAVHPAWDQCSPGAQKLHARNILITRGADILLGSLDPNVPPDRGGTRLGFRLAAKYGIPAIDVWTDEGKAAALEALKIPEKHLHDLEPQNLCGMPR